MALKKCSCLPLQLNSATFTSISLMLSLTVSGYAAIVLCFKNNINEFLIKELRWVSNMDMKINVIFITILTLGIIGVLFSALLILAFKYNYSGLVLCYFVYGFVLSIMLILTALLEMLQLWWITATAQTLLGVIICFWLPTVHSVYEQMQRGLFVNQRVHLIDEGEFNEDLD